MEKNMQTKIENYKETRKRSKKKKKAFLAISLVMILCTMYLLIIPALTQEGQAYCGYEEHIHDEACFVSETIQEKTLICELEESEEHTHGDDCFEITETLGEPVLECELEEHTHLLECFSNFEADLETPEVWKATFADVELSSNWASDVVAIAETQIGYTESENNYIVLEDGETKLGYTRYGEWYGMPYGEWSGMFTAFCLNYAGVEGVDYDQDVITWIDMAKASEQYREKVQYTPIAGDIVFLDTDKDGNAETVGIVREYMLDNLEEPAAVRVIAGDMENKVAENVYVITDEAVIGFLQTPENPNPTPTQPEEEVGNDGEQLSASTFASNNPANGDKYHAADYLYYQRSSHRLDGSSVVAFMLIPSDEYSTRWKPSGTPWVANGNFNYVVAYCCDKNTYSSSSGENYKTYTLDQSRFTDDLTRRTLDGIIKHAYPFISASEMKTLLKNAYAAKEISVDVTKCKESEFLAAAQWAIWDTTNVTGNVSESEAYNKPDESGQCYPLTSSMIGYDGTYYGTDNYDRYVKAIRDWLLTQVTPEDLEVVDYTANVERNAEGLYDLSVTVNLNRPVQNTENVDVKIVVSGKSSDEKRLATGATSFDIELDGLTEEQILGAEVEILLGTQGIHTYYYDSENYQDMIGGAWGTKYADLSFELAEEEIDISVTKVWNPITTEDKPVKVQLYADGKPYGDKVTLNKANGWKHTWTDLPKVNALYEDVEYTIREDLVPGYASGVAVQTGSQKATVWQKVDKFENNGTYLLQSKSGFLEQHTFDSNQRLTWSVIDLSDTASTPKAAMWTATTNGSGFNLKNNANTKYYLGYNSSQIYPRESKAAIGYDGTHLYALNGGNERYFTYVNTDGIGQTTSTANSAARIDIYKLTEVDLPNSDMNFVLTNTRSDKVISVDVTKEWQGKRDGVYPMEVEVTLLQNGKPYGNPIVLNEDNDWSYRWVDLPQKAGEDTFEYSLEETPLGGYESKLEDLGIKDGVHSFKITNTWIPEYATMLLSKVDLEDARILLPGAVFELYGYALQNEPVTTISGEEEVQGSLEQTIIVGPDGTVKVDKLIVGEPYYLVEKIAPNGYSLLEEPIRFIIEKQDGKNVLLVESAGEWASVVSTDEGLAIEIKNEVGYSLPETGGIGEEMFKIVGVILMLIAALLILKRGSVKL